MSNASWHDLGSVDAFSKQPITEVHVGGAKIAVTHVNGQFGAISGVCNHVGGPLGQGRLDGEYVVCPWHHWKFHGRTGEGEPGYEKDAVPRYDVKVEGGHLWVSAKPATRRSHLPHPAHPLTRPVERASGATRVAGISTTVMDHAHPRFSTSDALLDVALDHARAQGCETRLIRLRDLQFRHCEGYYSKSAHACTWPCSITQMDKKDQMEQVYEALVHWADVLVLSTPIRWGAASSLYFKMAERLNCVQNQITIGDNVLIRNKVACFIITGGQDNVQAVAGQALGFFGELGFVFPPFPYIAHSRGWSAEDMENNVKYVANSKELRDGTCELVNRATEMSRILLGHRAAPETVARGGRKAHRLDAPALQ
jgi:nitrite reductase/ring-hydroxylating ferredoxin subunit/multimeric flavodoxin WrbA